MNQEHKIVLYQVEDTNIYVNVMFKEDTFWMTQKAMADLFECTTDNISLHLKNIYKEEELDENRTTEFFSVVQNEGQRNVKRKVKCYNLDAIIDVGYRVNSKKATRFRQWATKTLKEYITSTQMTDLSHINKVVIYSVSKYMSLDINARRNLEITEKLRDRSKKGTLLWVLDKTSTSMGGRLLRRWLNDPLIDENEINKRLGAVEELKNDIKIKKENKIMSKTVDKVQKGKWLVYIQKKMV